jgi:hypothetical protein
MLVETYEYKKINLKKLYCTEAVLQDIVFMIKRILKINIPVVNVTSVLPKFRKNYGNGGLTVTVTRIQVFDDTISSIA